MKIKNLDWYLRYEHEKSNKELKKDLRERKKKRLKTSLKANSEAYCDKHQTALDFENYYC